MRLTFLALGACACLFGCTTVTQNRFIVRQAELIPGVSAPLITGPALPAGSVSVSAGVQDGIAGQGESLEEGGLGSVIADAVGRAAVGYSGKHWDIAGAIELRPGSLAHAASSDASASPFARTWMVSPTIAFRGRIPLTDHVELGLLGELSLSVTKYSRDTLTDSNTTTYSPDGSTQSYNWSSATHDSGMVFIPVFRAGPMFSWRLGNVFGLTAGVLIVTEPYVNGVTEVTQTCTDGLCSGQTPDDVPVVEYAVAVVPFVSPTLQLGQHFRLIAQVFGNLASNSQLTQAAPGGAELMVQARF